MSNGPRTRPIFETIYGIVNVPAPMQAAVRLNMEPDMLPGSILMTLDTLVTTDVVELKNEEYLAREP